MSFFKRVINIIRSNINSGSDFGNSYSEIDTNSYDTNDYSEYTEKTVETEQKNISIEDEYYANLELPKGSSFEQIKSQYRKLLKKYHPDKFFGNSEKQAIAQEVVIKLNEAYNYFENKYKS